MEAAEAGASAFLAAWACLALWAGLAALAVEAAEAGAGVGAGAWANEAAAKAVNTAATSRFFFMRQSFVSRFRQRSRGLRAS